MLPPNSDDLTLMTDPVTRIALGCFALSFGAALAFMLRFIPALPW